MKLYRYVFKFSFSNIIILNLYKFNFPMSIYIQKFIHLTLIRSQFENFPHMLLKLCRYTNNLRPFSKLCIIVTFSIKIYSNYLQISFESHYWWTSQIPLSVPNPLTIDNKTNYIVYLGKYQIYIQLDTHSDTRPLRYLVRRINRYATVKGISNEAYVYRFENAHFAYWTRYTHKTRT